MGIVKKILLATLVLIISSGIFFMLVREQEVKENILRTSLEMFGNELLAMVPEGPEKERLSQRMNQFIERAENNQVPKTQIQEVVSAGLNMQMNQREIPPEKLDAMLKLSLDTTSVRRRRSRPFRSRTEEEQLAHQIRKMIVTQKEIERLMASDSIEFELRQPMLFDRDSTGLVIRIPADFMQHKSPSMHPEMQKKFEELERENMVRYEELEELRELALSGLEFVVPAIPPSARDQFIHEMQKWNKHMEDSMNFSIGFDPDSLEEFIKKFEMQIEKAAEKDY